MRVLVTGGAGFVGSHLVDALVERGHEVRVLDVLHPLAHHGHPDYLHPNVEYRWGDVGDLVTARDALDDIDAVSHQAAMVGLGRDFADIDGYVHDNDLATAVLLRALHEHKFDGRFVLASSMVVYGEGSYRCERHGTQRPGSRSDAAIAAGHFEPPCPECGDPLLPELVSEDAVPDPRGVYAATKLHQEHLCAIFAAAHGLAATVLRYHNVYGARMPQSTLYAGVASIFRSRLESGRAPHVLEDGGQRRDFVHVSDVARANVLALERDPPFDGPLNIASGSPHTILELAQALCVAFGADAPRPLVVGGSRSGDVRHIVADPRRSLEHLGFRASVTFEEGMLELARAPLRAPVGDRTAGLSGLKSSSSRGE